MKKKTTSKKQDAVEVGKNAIVDLLAKGKKKDALDAIVRADREALDALFVAIAGKKPHAEHPTDKVRAHAIRWASGDKNWMNDERETQSNPTHTKEGTEMKKSTKKGAKSADAKKVEKKVETKKNGNGAQKPAPKLKGENVMRKPDGTEIVHPWTERRAFFFSMLKKQSTDKKLTDDAIQRAAEKEFGKQNVGTGPWTVAEQRKRFEKGAKKASAKK